MEEATAAAERSLHQPGGVTKHISLGGQFGAWQPPPRSEAQEELPQAAEVGSKRPYDDDSCSVSSTSSDEEEPEERKKKHKKKKKKKKKKHKKKKHKKEKRESEQRVVGVPDSRLDPVDWMAQRLAKQYAKAERKAQKKKKAMDSANSSGDGITSLRAKWGGGDMGKVQTPLDMCHSGLEG